MILEEFSLRGRSALVIGGTSGIGEAIAHGLAEAGAQVAIAGRREDKLARALERLRKIDAEARGFAADVASFPALEKLADEAGGIDILVNCQGTTIIKPGLDFSAGEVEEVIATNQTSVFLACTVFGRGMIARGGGAILNIASLSAHRGWPGSAVYGMTKFAVASLTASLAAEWAKQGVRVNAISPGFFMTELNQAKMSEARKARALDRTPMARFGDLRELVGAAVYLVSPAAQFVTGAVLPVDGGYLAAGI